ncbi:Hypothetical protein A7982_01647 [Minicystis rosea]|nr:Hypothetical protein A7982_01647 [Minicystis rosea]
MLTNEIMGLLALWILWVNTLLVAAATWKQARELLRRRSEMRLLGAGTGEGLVRGRVAEGAVAVQRIDQVGRAVEGEDAIVFHDRKAEGEALGGSLSAEGTSIAIAPHTKAEVWLSADELAKAAACTSASAFDEAFTSARKARGFSRVIEAKVGPAADEVFVYGRVEDVDGARTIGPTAVGEMLVATIDPRAVVARKAALAGAFIAAELLLAAACTAVALWPPVFGRVSTIGGALCLGYFLLVQPAGTAVRDAILTPSRTPVRGTWKRATAPSEAAAHAT